MKSHVKTLLGSPPNEFPKSQILINILEDQEKFDELINYFQTNTPTINYEKLFTYLMEEPI